MEIETRLRNCPWYGYPVKIFKSEGGGDGGDCLVSDRERNGFYVRCPHCCLSFGYSPRYGGIYNAERILCLVHDWNDVGRRGENDSQN